MRFFIIANHDKPFSCLNGKIINPLFALLSLNKNDITIKNSNENALIGEYHWVCHATTSLRKTSILESSTAQWANDFEEKYVLGIVFSRHDSLALANNTGPYLVPCCCKAIVIVMIGDGQQRSWRRSAKIVFILLRRSLDQGWRKIEFFVNYGPDFSSWSTSSVFCPTSIPADRSQLYMA